MICAFFSLLGTAAPALAQSPVETTGNASPAELASPSATTASTSGTAATNWRPVLVAWSAHPLRSRLQLRRAEASLAEGNRVQAARELETAVVEDPDFAPAWWGLARIHLSSANPLFVEDLMEGFQASLHGYRAQSRLASRWLLTLDLIFGAAFLWIILVLLGRYLPFLHHQLRSWTQPSGHSEGKGWLLWIPVLALFTLHLGLLPLVCVATLTIWLYGGRRERWILSFFILFFAVQGVDRGLLSTPLVGVNETSTASLSSRAVHETPTFSLQTQLEKALEKEPENPDLHFARGLFLAHQGDFMASTADFRTVLKLRPNDAKAVNNLSSNHYFLGDYDRAVAGYQRGASIDSTQGSTYYNLAQSYIKKLFFKEGGDYMQRASRLGFELGSSAQRLPPGAVYHQAPSTAELWSMAWKERTNLRVLDLASPWGHWLGVPADSISLWLLATLLLSLMLSRIFPRERMVYECSNCGRLTCSKCSGEHEGSVLCPSCHTTAQRARSEMVLSTLLRNRRRASEFSFHSKVRRLNAWGLGAGDIYNGLRKRGVFMAILAWSFVFWIIEPSGFLADPWKPLTTDPLLAPGRVLSVAGLLLLFLLSRYGHSAWRSRNFLLHPSSMVRFSDLLENRGEKRMKA